MLFSFFTSKMAIHPHMRAKYVPFCSARLSRSGKGAHLDSQLPISSGQAFQHFLNGAVFLFSECVLPITLLQVFGPAMIKTFHWLLLLLAVHPKCVGYTSSTHFYFFSSGLLASSLPYLADKIPIKEPKPLPPSPPTTTSGTNFKPLSAKDLMILTRVVPSPPSASFVLHNL